MKLIIKHYWDFDIDFKEINKIYHSLIYFALKPNNLQTQEFVKTNYSFKPPIFKKIEKNKIYLLEFASNDISIINAIKNLTFNNFNIVSIEEEENLLESDFLFVSNYHSLLNDSICNNWMIEKNGLKNVQYRKEHSIKLLKELIEVQATILFKRNNPDINLEYNNKLDNGFEYTSFIKNIKIVNEVNLHIKNSYVTTYDLLIEVELNRVNSKLINNILNTGIGCKNGYGFGFVKSILKKDFK